MLTASDGLVESGDVVVSLLDSDDVDGILSSYLQSSFLQGTQHILLDLMFPESSSRQDTVGSYAHSSNDHGQRSI